MKPVLLLDLDGTLIDTPHYEAWRRAAARIGVIDFTYQEYVVHLAGRPRQEGAVRLLELKKGDARRAVRGSDDVSALAHAKQAEFLRLAARTQLFEDARRLLERVRSTDQCVKFYTASENAAGLLEAALRGSEQSVIRECVVRQHGDQTREALFASLATEYPREAMILVDDAPHAVDAACRLGMRGYQIRRNAYAPVPTESCARTIPTLDDIALPIRD
jgi:beta-phosphoglucomutase-like phosphatase (HAD superfamily)